MKIELNENGKWYHGTNKKIEVLREGSTITPWKELAEAFSHQPTSLGYTDDGVITHNGLRNGYLFEIAEEIEVGKDIYQHPRTTLSENAEFLTKRPLRLKYICDLPINPCIKFEVDYGKTWYFGSYKHLTTLKKGTLVTQWKELATAFSKKPKSLRYDDNMKIYHDGIEDGYVYYINADLVIGEDIYYDTSSPFDENVFLTLLKDVEVKKVEQ